MMKRARFLAGMAWARFWFCPLWLMCYPFPGVLRWARRRDGWEYKACLWVYGQASWVTYRMTWEIYSDD